MDKKFNPKEAEESIEETFAEEEKNVAKRSGSEVAALYGGNMMNKGTEEISQEDLNTPHLILLQKLTDIDGLENPKPGYYYRSDTGEMLETVDVNFVYVTKRTDFDEKKQKEFAVKEYYGFYAGTKEPFKLKMKGWGMEAHRNLQTEIMMYKNRYQIPMFALTVRLSSVDQEGVTKDNEDYKVKKITYKVLRDPKDQTKPLIETDPERVGFLYEAVERFDKSAKVVGEEVAAE